MNINGTEHGDDYRVDIKKKSKEYCNQNKLYYKCRFVNDMEKRSKCCKPCKKTTKYAMKIKDRCRFDTELCCKQDCCRPGKEDRLMFNSWDWDFGWY